MKNSVLLLLSILIFVPFAAYAGDVSAPSAQAIQIQWAATVLDTNIGNAENVLGKPDSRYADFLDDNAVTLEMATYSGFGDGENIEYDTVAFANLLGISESLLTPADFISFECNGTAGGFYETSDWVFSDGVRAIRVSYLFGYPDSAAIVVLGNVSLSDYANFFRIPNPLCAGDWVYILFDLDGQSPVNPSASTFTVTINAAGTRGTDSPEPDALGRIMRSDPMMIKRIQTLEREKTGTPGNSTETSESLQPEAGIPEQLTRHLTQNPTFTAWMERWRASNPGLEVSDFYQIEAPPTSDFIVAEEGAITAGEQERLYSPDRDRYLYFPDPGGEPDQEVWLYNRTGDHRMERIGCIGSSSWYDGGFWIDNEHFIILSTFQNTQEECWALIEYWDAKNGQRVLYEAIVNCGKG